MSEPPTEHEIIKLLYDTGHFWGPLNPDGHGIVEADLPRLTVKDAVVKAAVRSYQDFMSVSLDQFAMVAHDRVSIADGEIGPATAMLFRSPRCGCPDYPNPNESQGSGSWPAGCHDNDGVHEVTYAIDFSQLPASRDKWDAIEKRVLTAYADVNCLLRKVNGSANIRVSWRRLRGSTIGLAEFNSGACGDSVFNYLDPGFWPNDEDVADLFCHELGHNMNLPHTRGGIMNPSLIGGGTFSGWTKRDPSYGRLRRFFGDGEIPQELRWWEEQPEPPEPPTPPEPGVVTLAGTVTVVRDGQSLGEFILVPKPRV